MKILKLQYILILAVLPAKMRTFKFQWRRMKFISQRKMRFS